MATTATVTDLSIIVEYETDETKNGKAVTATQTFSNVNPAATDDQCLAYGSAIGALKAGNLAGVQKKVTSELSSGE